MTIATSLLNLTIFSTILLSPLEAGDCDRLKSLNLRDSVVRAAVLVPKGKFQPPEAGVAADVLAVYSVLPAFCRVEGVIKPTSDSHIEFELWLPAENWNGRFQGVGNGGWAGQINYRGLAMALKDGYAAASTDTGHKGGSPEFAVGHPEKLIDFAYRAVHEMTVRSKAIITAFYDRTARYSYWHGCSAGGGQGLMEAWRYPEDFDGILVGAAGSPLIAEVQYWWMWIAHAVHSSPARFLPAEKYQVIYNAALKVCDGIDGLADGLIQDPTSCDFDPKLLQCQGSDGPSCLTEAQVEAVRRLYSPPRHPRSGKVIHPGLQPGSELGWTRLAGPTPPSFATDFFRHLVFKDPSWDFRSVPFDSLVTAPTGIPGGLDPMNPELEAFFKRKGKLLMYHGWSDAIAAPGKSVEYYRNVVKTLGNQVKAMNSIRLFMVPGMAHCSGGTGPNMFDGLSALKRWVEEGKSPEAIIASQSKAGTVVRTRPLCPYPKTAIYGGRGTIDVASNFVCRVP